MTQIGLMIEGQDGLNWTRWQRLLQAAEDLGFQCLFRSDHYTNTGPPDKDSLELWVSLTYAASHTRRIEFGPLVTPVTFRHPTMTVRMAAAVDDLSDGRLVLGLGAGWQEREHAKFGIPFYNFPTRFDMLSEALELTRRLFDSDEHVSYSGEYFMLNEALLLPRPQRPGGPPILIGGNGPTRTLPLAARHADEWNGVFITADTYRERSTLLDELLKENGRQPESVKRSLMTQVVYGATDAEVQAKIEARGSEMGRTVTADDLRGRGILVGTGPAIVDQLGRLVEAGVQRFMLQWLDQDDIDGLGKMARDVLPHFHA